MRNANVKGAQALPALEFPYLKIRKHDWSAMYPNYEERMKAMGLYVCLMLREWLD